MKRFFFLSMLSLLLPVYAAHGQEKIPDSLAMNQFVAVVTGDFNQDTFPDAVMMTRGKEGMDVHFFLGTARGYLEPHSTVSDKIWGSADPEGFVGQEPSLKVTPSGSVQVNSKNEAIGRNRWNQTLTLAYRGGDFVVAGLTYSWYDTLDTTSAGECDVNLLTGKGKVQKGSKPATPLTFAPSNTSFSKWDETSSLKVCKIN